MKKALRVSVAVCILAAGCASTTHPNAASARATAESPATRAATAIDAILYTDSSREDLLAKLKPYASPMQSMEDVQSRLDFSITDRGFEWHGYARWYQN